MWIFSRVSERWDKFVTAHIKTVFWLRGWWLRGWLKSGRPGRCSSSISWALSFNAWPLTLWAVPKWAALAPLWHALLAVPPSKHQLAQRDISVSQEHQQNLNLKQRKVWGHLSYTCSTFLQLQLKSSNLNSIVPPNTRKNNNKEQLTQRNNKDNEHKKGWTNPNSCFVPGLGLTSTQHETKLTTQNREVKLY